MKDFIKSNWKMLLILVGIIVCFPIIILTPSPWGFIPREIGLTIVEYGGAILGGFLTLYGVWWTLDDSNKAKKKELELQYCPILLTETKPRQEKDRHLCTKMRIEFQHDGFNDQKLSWADQIISLKNVGRGEIQQITISNIQYNLIGTNNDTLTQELQKNGLSVECDNILSFVPIGGSIDLIVGLSPIKLKYWESLYKYFYSMLTVSLDLSVQGVFTSNDHKYRLSFGIATTCNKDTRKHELYDISLVRL